MQKDKQLGMTLDAQMHDQLPDIADDDGRSGAGQVLNFLRKGIEAFVRRHGRLLTPPESGGQQP